MDLDCYLQCKTVDLDCYLQCKPVDLDCYLQCKTEPTMDLDCYLQCKTEPTVDLDCYLQCKTEPTVDLDCVSSSTSLADESSAGTSEEITTAACTTSLLQMSQLRHSLGYLHS